jgi:hypothetical protein
VAQRAGTGKESWLNKLPAYQEVEKWLKTCFEKLLMLTAP